MEIGPKTGKFPRSWKALRFSTKGCRFPLHNGGKSGIIKVKTKDELKTYCSRGAERFVSSAQTLEQLAEITGLPRTTLANYKTNVLKY